MIRMNSLLAKNLLVWAIYLLLVIFIINPVPATAATTSQRLPSAASVTEAETFAVKPKFYVAQDQKRLKPPSRRQRKNFWERVIGLGRRGPCSNLASPLMALMPPLPDSVSEESRLAEGLENGSALTISAYPTFWFYVPEQLKEIDFAEFVMQDERDEDIFENPIRVRLKTSGIVSFKLPSREKPLQLNHPYHWYFSVVCDSDRPSRNPSIDGWIERVQLEISREELATVTPRERLELYADEENNIWHETLKLLAEQRCRYRQNPLYAEYWDTILQAVVRDVDRDKIDPLSYCSSKQQLQAVYDSLNIQDLGLTPVTD